MFGFAEFLILGLDGEAWINSRNWMAARNSSKQSDMGFRAEFGLPETPIDSNNEKCVLETTLQTSPDESQCSHLSCPTCLRRLLQAAGQILTLLKRLLLCSMGCSAPTFVCEIVSFRQVKPFAQSVWRHSSFASFTLAHATLQESWEVSNLGKQTRVEAAFSSQIFTWLHSNTQGSRKTPQSQADQDRGCVLRLSFSFCCKARIQHCKSRGVLINRMQTRNVVAAAVRGRVVPRLRRRHATVLRVLESIWFRGRGQDLWIRSRGELQFSLNRPE